MNIIMQFPSYNLFTNINVSKRGFHGGRKRLSLQLEDGPDAIARTHCSKDNIYIYIYIYVEESKWI